MAKTKELDVRALRDKLGLTQEQLADRLGTTKNTVARWERGEMIPTSYVHVTALQKLAEALKVTV